jgi:hypothetical protein
MMMTAMKDKLVSEGLYDQETCDVMSDAEAETLWRLHQEIGQAFDAACDAYAAILGLEKSHLSDEQMADLADGRYPNEAKSSTPLLACLKRYNDLGLKISNIRDDLVSRFRQDD